MAASIKLREVTWGDKDMLARWDRKPHVIAATNNEHGIDWDVELAGDDPWSEWFIAEADGRPIGVMQIIDPALEETHYWGECAPNLRALDIWIGEEGDLGRGYGTVMMHLAIEACFRNPAVTAILIDPLASNTRAHRFYRRLGFVDEGERMFDEDRCLVMRLDRDTAVHIHGIDIPPS